MRNVPASVLRGTLILCFVLFITLPLVMVLLEAFGADWFGARMLPGSWTLRWFVWAAQTVDLGGVLFNTAEIALLATVFTLVLALPAGWAIARYRLPLKSVLIGAILFPRMIPEITFALGVARIFYAIHLTNTAVGIALAHVILAAPFAVVVLISTFEGLDPTAAGSRRGDGLWSVPAVPQSDLAAGAAGHRGGGAVCIPCVLQRFRADPDGLRSRHGDPAGADLSFTGQRLSVGGRRDQHCSAGAVAAVPAGYVADGEPGKPAGRAEGRMTPTRLTLDHVGKRWGSFVALSDICLDVPRGMFLSLLGPSGCGKTTLLRVIVGALTPDGGRVVVDGSDVTRLPTHRRNMGMVFQSFALFPHLSVAENVDFPLSVRGLSRADRQQRVVDALRMVHLDMLADRYPRELSGGQQQRVGLARAIVYRPTILLLDEPLSNLDASLREEMRIEISQVTRQLDITAVYVTHDQREALALSDAIAVMNRGQVVQFGTPEEIYRFPRNDFIAHFVGYANALPVVIAEGCARIEAVGTMLQADIAGLTGPATAFIHAGAIVLEFGRLRRREPAGLLGSGSRVHGRSRRICTAASGRVAVESTGPGGNSDSSAWNSGVSAAGAGQADYRTSGSRGDMIQLPMVRGGC